MADFLQTYAAEGANETRTNTHHVCQKSSKELYISDEVLQHSNQKLRSIQSFVRLKKKTSAEPRVLLSLSAGLTLYAIEPILASDVEMDNVGYHAELFRDTDATGSTKDFQLWSDCFRASALISGSTSDVSRNHGHDHSILPEQVVIGCNEEDAVTRPLVVHPSLTNVGQRFGYAALTAMKGSIMSSTSKEQPQPAASSSNSNCLDDQLSDISWRRPAINSMKALSSLINSFDSSQLKSVNTIVRQGCIDSRSNFNHSPVTHQEADSSDGNDTRTLSSKVVDLWHYYGNMYFSSSSHKIFQSFGINEYAIPEVGDSLCTIPATLAPQWSRWITCSYNPNFHFAGVVISHPDTESLTTLSSDSSSNGGSNGGSSGGSGGGTVSDEAGSKGSRVEHTITYITLENWAVDDPEAKNDSWGFRCYQSGSGGASYHSQLTKTEGYGNVALTFRVKKCDKE